MFSSENVVPLLCDSALGNPEDAIAAKNEEIRESMGSLNLRTKTTPRSTSQLCHQALLTIDWMMM